VADTGSVTEHMMSQENEHTPSVRRIVLPSGRTIEVIRFQDGHEADTRELHVCPSCQSQLVQPVAWSEAAGERWDLTLECPNCCWTQTGNYARHEVELLEDQLDQGLGEMIDDLHRLARANTIAEIDRFSAALNANLILPEDF
jgi:hypothetical protein